MMTLALVAVILKESFHLLILNKYESYAMHCKRPNNIISTTIFIHGYLLWNIFLRGCEEGNVGIPRIIWLEAIL
jgi:hypothetical protein